MGRTDKIRRSHTPTLVVRAMCMAFAASGLLVQAPSALAASDSLRVPAELASKGTVYHTLTGRDIQIHFTSDAPLEKNKGQSNAVVGYAVAGPSDAPARLQGALWHLPVRSMKTGIELRDHHMAGKAWLNADSFPNIVFQFDRVEDIRSTKTTSTFSTYSVTLVGTMSIHGVTNDIRIPNATITFLPASAQTKKIAKGDLMAIRASYSITLSEYDVSHPVLGSKVADNIEIDTTLYLSTVPMERQ